MLPDIINTGIFTLVFLYFAAAQPTNSDSCLQYNNQNGVCEECIDGFYLDYFFCAPCAPLCICQDRSNYCLSCMNITLKDGLISQMSFKVVPQDNPNLYYCKLCSQVIEHCLQCNSADQCLKCMNGRYVENNGLCSNQTCDINCEVCLTNNSCERCSAGHYLIDKGNRKVCSTNYCLDNCIICSSDETCELCEPFFFQENGTCLDCPQNCTVCNDTDLCTLCLPGTYFINGSCQDVGVSNCILIAGGFWNPTCLVCEPGYYNAQGSCTQCQGCQLCSMQFICYTECLSGYEKFNYACNQKLNEYWLVRSIIAPILLILLLLK